MKRNEIFKISILSILADVKRRGNNWEFMIIFLVTMKQPNETRSLLGSVRTAVTQMNSVV